MLPQNLSGWACMSVWACLLLSEVFWVWIIRDRGCVGEWVGVYHCCECVCVYACVRACLCVRVWMCVYVRARTRACQCVRDCLRCYIHMCAPLLFSCPALESRAKKWKAICSHMLHLYSHSLPLPPSPTSSATYRGCGAGGGVIG